MQRLEYDVITAYNQGIIALTFVIWALNIFYVGILVYYSLSFVSYLD